MYLSDDFLKLAPQKSPSGALAQTGTVWHDRQISPPAPSGDVHHGFQAPAAVQRVDQTQPGRWEFGETSGLSVEYEWDMDGIYCDSSWDVYVHMCIYVYITYICIYIYMYVCVCVRVYVYDCICICVRISQTHNISDCFKNELGARLAS